MTVRIDTLRNRLGATATLLESISAEVTELHSMAYERHRGAAPERVRGGTRDYALDNNGSPDARAAYQALGDGIVEALEQLAVVLHDAHVQLRAGGNRGNQSRRLITVGDLGTALAAQARRLARGEGVAPHLPQPEQVQALRLLEERAVQAEKERDRLRARVAKLEARIGAADRAAG